MQGGCLRTKLNIQTVLWYSVSMLGVLYYEDNTGEGFSVCVRFISDPGQINDANDGTLYRWMVP
jgi:hypothetical protein